MTVFKGIDSTSDLDYPTVDPTLDLNFALTKTLDPRITFTRNSTGTYVGPDGLIKTAVENEPRFDHDPVTGKCLGLLIEEQKTNPYPFSNSWGIGYNSNPDGTFGIIDVTTDYGIAPDGTKTSVGLTRSTSKITTYQSTIPNPSGANCFSFFAKPIGNQSTIRLFHYTGININIVYNFNTLTSSGTVTNVSSYSHGIIKLSNGWYRVYMVFVAPTLSFWPTLANSGLVEVWGKQLESGSFPTSYIPTSGSTVTRAADDASITGTNFSSWYNDSSSTFAIYGRVLSDPALYVNQAGILSVIGPTGSADNNFRMRIVQKNIGKSTQFSTVLINPTGPSEFNIQTNPDFPFNYKVAVGYSLNGHSAYTQTGNGSSVTYTRTPYQGANKLQFYPDLYRANHIISRLTYYPKRLPDSQLQLLTQN